MSNIRYQDFLPKESSREGFFGGVDYASFDSCVDAMNHWLERNPVQVMRVETVMLPNIHNPNEEGSGDTELLTTQTTNWYQFVRLWYTESAAD